MLARRLISVSLVFATWAVSTATAPLWLTLSLLIDLTRAAKGKGLATCRLLGYGFCFLWIEVVALLGLAAVGLGSLGAPERRKAWAYALQQRYVSANLAAVRVAFRLRFEVEGEPERPQVVGPLTVFVRHSSLIDVLIPGVFVANRFGLRLRYVLKRELLWEPCLDIAGHWMPNHFVDRTGGATEDELKAIDQLQQRLGPGEGVVLYPEGTRFTPAKRERALARLTADPVAHTRASRLRHLLPIRPGGASVLLDAHPARDVLLVGHTGLEGFSSLRDIWSGALLDRTIHVRYWRESGASIPKGGAERMAWLAERWQRLDDWLEIAEPVRSDHAA